MKGERVSHLVFMGMGEPMENYDAVVKSIEIFHLPEGLQYFSEADHRFDRRRGRGDPKTGERRAESESRPLSSSRPISISGKKSSLTPANIPSKRSSWRWINIPEIPNGISLMNTPCSPASTIDTTCAGTGATSRKQ